MINVTAFLEYKSRRRLKSSEKEPKPVAPSTFWLQVFPPGFPKQVLAGWHSPTACYRDP